MINANAEEYLDMGWFSECTLYLNGFTYWCEGYVNPGSPKPFHFFVNRYASRVVFDVCTTPICDEKGHHVRTLIYEIDAIDEWEAKEMFFKAPLFEGKTIMEVFEEIAWYDEVFPDDNKATNPKSSEE